MSNRGRTLKETLLSTARVNTTNETALATSVHSRTTTGEGIFATGIGNPFKMETGLLYSENSRHSRTFFFSN